MATPDALAAGPPRMRADAQLKDVPLAVIQEVTTANAYRLFGQMLPPVADQ